MTRLLTQSTVFLTISFTLCSCSPKIYLIDRQTVLEEQAAGEWPDFERELLQSSTASGPTPFPQPASSEKKKRLYQILNGEIRSAGSEK